MADLFNHTPPHPHPLSRASAAETSAEAADAIAPVTGRIASAVLSAIEAALAAGLTADEVCARTGFNRWTAQPRVSELKNLGKVVDSGQRRRNSTGKNAVVWVVPKFAPKREKAA